MWDSSDAAREAAQADGARSVSQRQCYAVAWRAQSSPPPHVSLLPRLRKWFRADRVPTPALEAWIESAVASVAQTAPTFGISVLRTWCDAWATSARHGHHIEHCILCGRAQADRVSHLVRCAPLWRARASAAQVAPPDRLRQSLCLDRSPRLPGRSAGKRARPPASVFALAVASDTYHKLRARRPFYGRTRAPFDAQKIQRAAVHAARRLGRL